LSKPTLGNILSVSLNIILSLWLINDYFYNVYFQTYVNNTFAEIYPFLIVAIGVGGGSGLGYVLLKRRHPEQSVAARLQAARPLRQVSPVGSGGAHGRGLASIASSAQATRHTAYAVPPLPKSPPSSGQRITPTLSWTAGQRSSSPMTSTQRPESILSNPAITPTPQSPKSEPSSLKVPGTDQSPPSVSRVPSSFGQWRPETSAGEGKVVPSGSFAKPGVDPSAAPGGTTGARQPGPGAPQQSGFQPSKWQSPDAAPVGPRQWVDPVPKQGYVPAPKWVPPTGPGSAVPPPPGGQPPRPGPFGPPRPPFAQSQPPPRPLAYPGAMRPPEAGGPGGPRPFRPEPGRPMQGGVPPPRPPIQGQGPAPQPGQPWAPQTGDRAKPPLGAPPQSQPASGPPNQRGTPAPREAQPASDSQPGEMDWDTALDTILKTLRKDKLVEK
jgi:hypothetical protein